VPVTVARARRRWFAAHRRTGNGGTNLPIYGDMWTEPTISYTNKVNWNPGQFRMHYELTLNPNGVITGSVG
jgi:hypothetical protein